MVEAVVVSGGVVLVTALLVILIRRVQGTSGIRGDTQGVFILERMEISMEKGQEG